MSFETKTIAFPNNEIQALAMLYLENQDLTSLSPEELLEKYQDTCQKIEYRKNNPTNPNTVWV